MLVQKCLSICRKWLEFMQAFVDGWTLHFRVYNCSIWHHGILSVRSFVRPSAFFFTVITLFIQQYTCIKCQIHILLSFLFFIACPYFCIKTNTIGMNIQTNNNSSNKECVRKKELKKEPKDRRQFFFRKLKRDCIVFQKFKQDFRYFIITNEIVSI